MRDRIEMRECACVCAWRPYGPSARWVVLLVVGVFAGVRWCVWQSGRRDRLRSCQAARGRPWWFWSGHGGVVREWSRGQRCARRCWKDAREPDVWWPLKEGTPRQALVTGAGGDASLP